MWDKSLKFQLLACLVSICVIFISWSVLDLVVVQQLQLINVSVGYVSPFYGLLKFALWMLLVPSLFLPVMVFYGYWLGRREGKV